MFNDDDDDSGEWWKNEPEQTGDSDPQEPTIEEMEDKWGEPEHYEPVICRVVFIRESTGTEVVVYRAMDMIETYDYFPVDRWQRNANLGPEWKFKTLTTHDVCKCSGSEYCLSPGLSESEPDS